MIYGQESCSRDSRVTGDTLRHPHAEEPRTREVGQLHNGGDQGNVGLTSVSFTWGTVRFKGEEKLLLLVGTFNNVRQSYCVNM